MEDTISLIIADDHRLFRTGLVGILTNVSDLRVLEEAVDGEELIDKYMKFRPDVVVADISMPKISGYDAFKEIKKYDPHTKFLFLSMYESPEYVHYTLKIGGKGLLGKDAPQHDLIYAIRQVAAGKSYFGIKWPDEKLEQLKKQYTNLADGKLDPNIFLTNKEKEVLYYISEGFASSEIADKMWISKRTVDKHRANLMKKTKSSSLSQLIAFAIKFITVTDYKLDD